jgi:predicted ATPase/DNA-binding winged helix-turn-helix (wHTH) protein
MRFDHACAVGDHWLDTRTGELHGAEGARKLTPKATAVLRLLAMRAGELVTKTELMDSVWAGTVVSDAALTSCIQELRDALRDDARRPRYIETLHRRGYRLIAPVAAGDSDGVRCAKPMELFVGRAQELAQLRARLGDALTGFRRFVFVTGEAGVGKSALIDALLCEINAEEVVVATGQCVEQHGPAEAYLPLLDALTRLCRGDRGQRVKAILARQAPGWLSQLHGLLSDAELAAVQRRTIGATPHRLLGELTEAIEAIAADAPLILRLEDLHWSDAATLDWLSLVARRIEPARLLILGTYRSMDALPRDHALLGLHADLKVRGCCSEQQLGPLASEAVQTYFAERFGATATIAQLAMRVHARTEGHPLFVVNLANDLVARGALVLRDGSWAVQGDPAEVSSQTPGDLRRMIEYRLDCLPQEDRALLETASVVGVKFSAAAVAAGALRPLDVVDVALARLVQRDACIRSSGVEVWPDGTCTGRFSFAHALHRETLYERFPAAARRAAHERIGLRLEQAFGARTAQLATELAVHFEEGRDAARAVLYRRQAAENAMSRGAAAEAVAHLRRAAGLLGSLPESAERTRADVEISIALGSQLMATRGWGAEEARRAYMRAQRLCEDVADKRQLFPALWGLWLYWWGQGNLADADALCASLRTLADEDSNSELRLQARHASWATAFSRGHLHECITHAIGGAGLYEPHLHAALAGRYGNHDAGACARCFRALALALLGQREATESAVKEALSLAETLGQPFTLALTRYFAAAAYQLLGDIDSASLHARGALHLAAEQGFALLAAWSSCIADWADAMRSADPAALKRIAAATSTARRTGTDQFQPYLQVLLAAACVRCGNAQQGLDAVRCGQGIAERTGEVWCSAELARLEGELWLMGSESAVDSAERRARAQDALRRAVELACVQGAEVIAQRAAQELALLAAEPLAGRTALDCPATG